MNSSPFAFSKVRFPCDECNWNFRSRSYFANHKQITAKRKSVCERKGCCTPCGAFVTDDSHECNKLFCANCKQNREVGHLCYMRPLKDVYLVQVIRYYTYFTTLYQANYEVLWQGTQSRLRATVLFAVWRCGILRRMGAMRLAEALVLGRSFGGAVIIRTWGMPLCQKERRDCAQRQGVRLTIHSEKGDHVEMAARTDHEQVKDNVY